MQYVNILIVEDDPISSEVLAGWARQLGSTVTAVGGTAEADAALAANDFDLIVSDVHLPGNHQLEWVERVLASAFPPPILLLTGNPELGTTLRAANLPVAGYLVKPPDFNVLNRLARQLIGDRRQRRELRELSREAAWLLTQAGDEADPVRTRLLQLSRDLAAEAGRNPREAARSGGDGAWRAAITETITVLEKTKDSFRSKELGALRQRLQRLVAQTTPPCLSSAA